MNLNWKIVEPVQLTLKSGRVRNSYLIECKCGNRRHIHLSEWKRLLTNTHKSHIQAGCRQCSLLSTPIEKQTKAAYKNLYDNLKSSCTRINRVCSLSLEEASTLYQSNCYYCGTAPSNLYKSPNLNQFTLRYSGIDRIDSNKGYTNTNVVSCCFNCNRAKSNLDQREFLELVKKIYSFRVHRLSERSE